MRGSLAGGAGRSTTVVGGILIVAAIVATVLSYSANRGLPFVPTYNITVQVPDAAELIAGSSEVRLGGSRVGIVKEVRAVPGKGSRRAYAELDLGLEKAAEELPVDTRAEVRPRSILGAKFVELTKGKSTRGIAPDGTLPISQATAVVGLDEAFKVFEPKTRKALQDAVVNLGDGLAGRGSAFNDTIGEAGILIAPLQRVLRTLTLTDTRLGPAIAAADSATAVLAPVAPQIEGILDDGATTLAALNRSRPDLDRTIADTPATLIDATRAARSARPVLDDTVALMRGLRPATVELPRAATSLRTALRIGTPVLGRVPGLGKRLDATTTVLRRVALQPTTTSAIQRLRQAIASTQNTLDVVAPAQLTCNTMALFFRNIGNVVAEGDAGGSWFDTTLNIDLGAIGQRHTTQGATFHANPLPTNDGSQCETGNEPYEPGRRVGAPGGLQTAGTETTQAPADATRRGIDAGLVTP